MTNVDLIPIVDEGLGNAAYLLSLRDGRALAVDASRDLREPQDGEFATGHVPNAEHVELGRLAAHVSDLPTGPTVVMCGHGERAMGAASILQRSGKRDVAVLDGGPADWAHASGRSLEVSR